MKREKIKEIAELRFGYNAKTENQGELYCLQGKDFDEYGNINHSTVYKVKADSIKSPKLLQEDEILFSAKGSRNYAVIWKSVLTDTVASSTFIILTTKTNEVAPEYLTWYLNSPMATNYFSAFKKEGTIPVIGKKAIENFEIAIPTIHDQQKIIDIHNAWLTEKQLCKTLIEKRELLMNTVLKQYLS
jgi:restriction endonuclease S subunit